MRMLLTVIGSILLFGAAANVAMALVALYFIGAGGFADPPGMTVETVIRDHARYLEWTLPAAEAILPAKLAHFFFAAPALILFPARATIAFLLGAWALSAARRRRVA